MLDRLKEVMRAVARVARPCIIPRVLDIFHNQRRCGTTTRGWAAAYWQHHLAPTSCAGTTNAAFQPVWRDHRRAGCAMGRACQRAATEQKSLRRGSAGLAAVLSGVAAGR